MPTKYSMGSFQELLNSEANYTVFGDFGESCTYTPFNSDIGETITVVVGDISVATVDSQSDGSYTVHRTTLTVPSGNYRVGDRFTVRGKTWLYEGHTPVAFDGVTQQVDVKCVETVEKSGENYRKVR